jgi:hypothetical protein
LSLPTEILGEFHDRLEEVLLAVVVLRDLGDGSSQLGDLDGLIP